ncbi:P-loop containing nucleoside triphosphate hydrolase protein [Xylaria intraflava]|nr:P-loop containing nucleoside triphosphate hydrolase protein [Xylaria intraflava]
MNRPGSDRSHDLKEEMAIIQNQLKINSSVSTDVPEWQTFPEIPTAKDLNPDWNDPKDQEKIHSLLPNNWQYAWPDKNTYLETHYRLQREEAIAILRYSIKKYREFPDMVDDDETCVYTKIFVRGYLMTRLGPMCRIQFSTERAGKAIRWTQTRRLATGSLVAISTAADGFKTICMPAIISDHPIRDGLDQNPPTIQILWANTEDAILDPTNELVMLESRLGYFEAVRHCMVGLQHVATTSTPLDKYLVNLDKSDQTAKYVIENPKMNISSLVHHIQSSSTLPAQTIRDGLLKVKNSFRSYPVLNGIDDGLSRYTNLDNSQLSAVHRILTKELAIVQGPPGTGKTFTSVQALQILLESEPKRGNNVIVVAAQTNHAVDQILTQLIDLGFNTVRLGGRTQNEDIKRHNMFNLRRFTMRRRSQNEDRDYRSLETARKRNIARFETIIANVFSDDLLDPVALREAGIITEKQLESLTDNDGWVNAATADGPAENATSVSLIEWLGDQRIKAPSMEMRSPEFDIQESDDKADFEVEDYDMELDDCITDEDEHRGRVDGKWVPIQYQWTGANPGNFTENGAVVRQELQRENLWDIAPSRRGIVYQSWQRQLLRLRQADFQAELAATVRICRNLKANRWLRDVDCVKSTRIEIIGCTTTGLCKYRGLLAALKPRTMLIEEAAETKEANILSALYPSLQQLILVGDHQQLAPSCDTPFLDEEPYNIRVSMFERLVKLDMPYTILNMQRRMAPTLRELLNPFYPDLQDHPVVAAPGARPPIPGMAHQSLFFHHTWSENTDENLSKLNVLEAEMIVRFIDYLLMNGVKGAEITVLTFYRGQRKKLLSEFRKLGHREPFTNVHTVDSYQGEENDIVVLSLVRSNGPHGPHSAGFLRESNRSVVSISRARRGFYIFGNAINLLRACKESYKIWNQVKDIFEQQNRFCKDGRLPIVCQQHGRTSWISHPDEWINHHGGCSEPCLEKLPCGHDCGRRCHWMKHSQLTCLKPCEKVLNCGHHCQKSCGENCKCTCEVFTGAYSTDEIWDDDAAPGTSEPRSRASPFIGFDCRLGKLRGGSNLSHGRQRTSTPETFSTRLNSTLAREWARFDAEQHDAAQLQEYQRGNSVRSEARDAQDASDRIEPIQETFLQVTLNWRGGRNVREGVVSDSSSTVSPERVDNMPREDVNVTRTVQSAGDVSARDAFYAENMSSSNSTHSGEPSLQGGASGVTGEEVNHSSLGTRNQPNGYSTSESSNGITDPQQRNAGAVNQPNQSQMNDSDNEDKPEWEHTSIEDEAHAYFSSSHEESEENLIDL